MATPQSRQLILPSLDEAVAWCRDVGVNFQHGVRHSLIGNYPDWHESAMPLEKPHTVVIHRSGFAMGNAAMLRWYHRVVNGWADIGYHFVIGNGKGGYSVDGQIERGRPSEWCGAHVRGHNQGTLAICLIGPVDHTPPTHAQSFATVTLLNHIFQQAGKTLSVVGHHDLDTSRACPGTGIQIHTLQEKAVRKFHTGISNGSPHRTLDLRASFQSLHLKPSQPVDEIPKLKQLGYTRLVFPFHWGRSEWESLDVIHSWSEESHKNGLALLMYTGPFGTEWSDFPTRHPEARDWVQRDVTGQPVTYDKRGHLLMFCPLSPYVESYRLPRILKTLTRTSCDGVFLDIPWLMKNACYCPNCRAQTDTQTLSKKESSVRKVLFDFVRSIRNVRPQAWITANAGAPGIWDTRQVGATPRVLSGLVDEIVTEWTPVDTMAVQKIRNSGRLARTSCPGSHSHAFQTAKISESLANSVVNMLESEKSGIWETGRVLPNFPVV